MSVTLKNAKSESGKVGSEGINYIGSSLNYIGSFLSLRPHEVDYGGIEGG